ncbi:E3 ubiquitin-protein ligase Topors-like [Chiroxiphia lanceolata]|uniref:E3 ubiquitin-protein ligase Topors-like n=1 Tax=Chiroxiphia lanceolata TaxID=296741 RepID=UPI0013CE4681|nr:E3 ubiquitin-protein ligase Topors-like [Chiroxiphia lanceolata]
MSQLPPAGPSEVAAADGRCPICLGDLENATYVEVCQHCFCFICIREWAKLTETCPLCKQPFERLLHTVTVDGNYEEYVFDQSAHRQRKAARIRSRSPQWHYNLCHRSTDIKPSKSRSRSPQKHDNPHRRPLTPNPSQGGGGI